MKKVNYFKTKELLNLFYNYKDDILVISHSHYFNSFEALEMKRNCKQNKVILKKVKSNLIKKLFKNNFLANVLSGPTTLFFFSNFMLFTSFFSLSIFQKKIIPLVIY